MNPAPRLLLALLLAAAAGGAAAQPVQAPDDPAEIRRAMAQARSQGRAAQQRAERLEAEAARATEAADKTLREAAAIAARIQQSEARIAAAEAQARLISAGQTALRTRLAAQQQPVVRLTAALQRLSRRPPVFSLLRPGSVSDAVHARAVLHGLLPEIDRRTADLRAEIDRTRALERHAALTAAGLRAAQADLRKRRDALAALETRQRVSSRAASGIADREAERALSLAEQARDLDTLAASIGRAGELRQALADLPGPVLRPARPEQAQSPLITPSRQARVTGLASYMLPLSGRIVTGFDAESASGLRSRGIALAPRPGALAVAPAGGRVAFAGLYRGYGRIVILEHGGEWTSLITGLAELDIRAGDTLVAGSPIGRAGAGRPTVTVELRRGGEPVNPLAYLRSP